MFDNQQQNNQEFNNDKLNHLQEGLFEEISEAESENVNGGYFVYNPYVALNSFYWPSTQAILSSTANMQNVFDAQNDYWLRNF